VLIALGLLLIIVLTAATGYFVAQEFGYVAVDRGRLQRLARDGDAAAGRALTVTGRLSFMLSGAQLGITVTGLLVGYVAEPYLGAGLADLLGRAIPASVSLPLSVGLALVFATAVQMVLGELTPKNLAIARAEALARALSRSTLVYLTVAGPVIKVFDVAARRLLRRAGIEPVEELPSGATPEDLEQIIAESREEGHLDPEMSTLLDRGLDFRELSAGEAMVPRVDVHTVRADEPVSRVVDMQVTGHSRFPVRSSDNVDDLVGVIGLAEVLGVPPAQRPTTPISAVMLSSLLVPETLPLPRVLERLRAGRRQLACVVDEYGGFAGVVTLEDIAEELVGPIHDEDDPPERAPVRQRDGSWVVPARWRIDEVEESTGISLPEAPEYDTLSGLVMRELGRVPAVGDRLEIGLPADHDGERVRVATAVVEVLAVDRRVPDSVRVTVVDR
jgi:CBS domain containing-hemolysin-like protein